MATRVVFAMFALQCQYSSAVYMYRQMDSSSSTGSGADRVGTCEAGGGSDEWKEAEKCEKDGGKGYMKITCSGDNVVSTYYNDSSCTTTKTDIVAAGFINGVADPKDACVQYSPLYEVWSKVTCAGQPDITIFKVYNDSSCTTLHPAANGQTEVVATNFCSFEQKKNDDGKYTKVLSKAEKMTITGGKLEHKEYTTPDCSDAGTMKLTGTTCIEVEVGKIWYKVESTVTASEANKAAGSSAGPAAGNSTGTKGTTSSAPLKSLSLLAFALSVAISGFA